MEIKFFIASNKPLDLYECILENQHTKQHPKTISVDDNERGLSERHNEFIEQVLRTGEYCWIVFMHDDVAFREDPTEKIINLPPDKIYGFCGAKKTAGKGEIVGQIRQPRPDGKPGAVLLGRRVDGHEIVTTIDGLCTIVHSAVFKFTNLRFDENLMYHGTTDELCINAKKNYNVDSAVVQVECMHMSWGKKDQEYFESLKYIKQKHGLEAFVGTCEKTCLDHYQDNDGLKCLK